MTDMSNMLDGTNDFAWNLGDWYIVLDDTVMSDANETLAISAQNAYLDGQNPTYVVDDANFAVVDGALAVKPGQSVPPGTYNVTVTVGGVIGEVVNTSHSRTVQVTMEGDVAQPTILSTAYLTGNGTLTVTFSEPLNGTIRYDRLHVRDAGQLSDGISLDEAQDKHSSGSAVTVLLAAQQRADFAKMVAPQLNVDHGAVFDVSGNGVAAAIRPCRHHCRRCRRWCVRHHLDSRSWRLDNHPRRRIRCHLQHRLGRWHRSRWAWPATGRIRTTWAATIPSLSRTTLSGSI